MSYLWYGETAPSETNENSTRETAEKCLRLLGEGDADRIGDIFAEEIDWYVPGREDVPWVGARSRRQQVAIHQVVVEGADAIVLGRFAHTVKGDGRRFSTPVAIHLTHRQLAAGLTSCVQVTAGSLAASAPMSSGSEG